MFRKVSNIIISVILVVLVVFVVVIFAARLSGNNPSLFGYHIFRVSSDSMTPTFPVGEVILVKKCQPEDIRQGDIITYIGEQGEFRGLTITHRVAEEPVEYNGEYHYRTKGDKQGATLDPEISFRQVEGKYVISLPLVDKLYSFFLSPVGLIVFIAVIVILFGYEMISLVFSYRADVEEDDEYYAPKNRKPKKKRKK